VNWGTRIAKGCPALPRITRNVDPNVARNRAAAGGHASWARTRDRSARTAPAREARWAKYLERARELQGPDATPEAVERAAESLRQADMKRMSIAASRARAAKRPSGEAA
jgi:hypothetical protein